LWKGEVSNSDNNDRLTTVIKNFNSFVKEDERVEKTILPLGDGLTICKKI
jgi:predicted O-methyltransferase YrrM